MTSQKQLLELPIDELELSTRVVFVLHELGCRTVGDVTKLTEGVVLRQPGFGRKSLNELKEVLNEMGLRLEGTALRRSKIYPFNLAKEERNMTIYRRHVAGELQKDLAKEYGISQGRVSGLCLQYERRYHLFAKKWAALDRGQELDQRP